MNYWLGRNQSLITLCCAVIVFVCAITSLTVSLGWIGYDRPPHKSEYRVAAAAPAVHHEGDEESLYDGWVRSINWNDRTFLYETIYGYSRIFGPICHHPEQLPVWEGEAISQINFRWVNWAQDTNQQGCYAIDAIQHDASRDYTPAKK